MGDIEAYSNLMLSVCGFVPNFDHADSASDWANRPPDGPAPYFTFHAAGRHGELIPQWHTIKSAALDAVIGNGGTVTHHHAVGRDHRPWYDRQRLPLFAAAPRAAKASIRMACLIRAC